MSNNNKCRRWVNILAAYMRTHGSDRLAWSQGRQSLGIVLHRKHTTTGLKRR